MRFEFDSFGRIIPYSSIFSRYRLSVCIARCSDSNSTDIRQSIPMKFCKIYTEGF